MISTLKRIRQYAVTRAYAYDKAAPFAVRHFHF